MFKEIMQGKLTQVIKTISFNLINKALIFYDSACKIFCTLFKDFNVLLKVIQMMQSQMEVADSTGTTVILQEMNLKLQEREVEIHQLKVNFHLFH